MKVLLVNGSPHPKGCTFTALAEIMNVLNKEGVETELMQIGGKTIRGCIDCRKCAQTGYCVFGDDPVNEGIDKLHAADGFIIGSPVYYAGPNATLCAFLDRVFFLKSSRYALKPAAAIVSCRRGGATAAFDRLNKYFSISNMPIVSSQYWNMVHGMNAEETRQDIEGLQTMRTLAQNMAWLLKSIEAGKKTGIEAPKHETGIYTNFIR